MPSYFTMQHHQLYAEEVPVAEIAKAVDTPCYIYSRCALEEQWQSFKSALDPHPHQINYAVKANSNLAVLNLFARLGSGFDIVSLGELERVLHAGGRKEGIVFSGVGKSTLEITRALQIGIQCINVESRSELFHINEIAKHMNLRAAIALRINPDVDAESHPYISTGLKENKFGIHLQDAKILFQQISQLNHLDLKGIAFHIGSQITRLHPFIESLEKVLALIDELKLSNIHIKELNVGGGLGVRYRDETPPTPTEYVQAVLKTLKGRDLKIHMEPGRILTANAGILVTKLHYIKERLTSTENGYYGIVDAGMNDLLRPTLYSAWQDIVPVYPRNDGITGLYDIVGPVCETGDFLGNERALTLQEGDLLAVLSAGAYGFSMCSNYNSRPRPAEIMVDKDQFHVVREREQVTELFRGERLLP